jgi:hypothetical protein
VRSKWDRFHEWLKERHSQLAQAILVVVAASVIVGWQIPIVQDALVNSGVLQLLILFAVTDLSITVWKIGRSSADLVPVSGDLRGESAFVTHINNGRPGNASVLAVTGFDALPVVRQLVAAGWRVRLLIKNPPTFVAEEATIEAQATIKRISDEKRLADRTDVRLYDGTPAMHGVLFPNTAVIGWLKYNAQSHTVARYRDYPMVLAERSSMTGHRFYQMLSDEIEGMWSTAKEVP